MAMATRAIKQEGTERTESRMLEQHMVQLAQYLAGKGLLAGGKLAGYFVKHKNDKLPSELLVGLPPLRAVLYETATGKAGEVFLLDPKKAIKPANVDKTVGLRGLSGEVFKGAAYGKGFYVLSKKGLDESGMAGDGAYNLMSVRLAKNEDVYFLFPKAGVEYKNGIW